MLEQQSKHHIQKPRTNTRANMSQGTDKTNDLYNDEPTSLKSDHDTVHPKVG